jgi:hypothetical protein
MIMIIIVILHVGELQNTKLPNMYFSLITHTVIKLSTWTGTTN